MRAPALYDRIGTSYGRFRQPDPRIAAQIGAALGSARTIIDVGAGTGSYEPAGRRVIAVEPSEVMLAQRPADAAPAVRAVAEALPFPDHSFDAALAILTVHHTDGFGEAYWGRPEAYLDPGVRASMSACSTLSPAEVDAGVNRLRADLASGRWDERHGHLRRQPALDTGHRLIIASFHDLG